MNELGKLERTKMIHKKNAYMLYIHRVAVKYCVLNGKIRFGKERLFDLIVNVTHFYTSIAYLLSDQDTWEIRINLRVVTSLEKFMNKSCVGLIILIFKNSFHINMHM